MEERGNLAHNTRCDINEKGRYMDGSEASLAFCRARMDDVWSLAGAEVVQDCPGCGVEVECVWEHVIKVCNSIIEERERVEELLEGKELSCDLLGVNDRMVGQAVGRLVLAWQRRWKKVG